MAAVTAQAIPAAGAAPSLSSASGGGDTIETDTILHVISGSTACTLTITTPGTNAYGDAIADPTFVIPTNSGLYSSGAAFQIKIPRDRFGDPTTGLAALSWSATTNIKFWVTR